MENIKIVDQFFSIYSFHDYYDAIQKVKFGDISLQPPWTAQNWMVSFVPIAIFVWNVVQLDVQLRLALMDYCI